MISAPLAGRRSKEASHRRFRTRWPFQLTSV